MLCVWRSVGRTRSRLETGVRTGGGQHRLHAAETAAKVAAPVSVLLALFAVLIAAARPVLAVDIALVPQPVTRTILALYDSRAEPAESDTRIHRFAEMPLNHLGFRLVYRDVNQPLPSPDELTGYRAVLTWLLEDLAEPGKLGMWLADTLPAANLRHVVLGEALPGAAAADKAVTERILQRLGLVDGDAFVEVTLGAGVASADATMIGFERPLDKVLPPFPVMLAIGEQTNVHLGLKIPDAAAGERDISAVAVTGPGGGFVAEAFTIYYEPDADRLAWIVNPFAFFDRALGAERFPVPDTTTVAGRRIYFSHIDGDGWNNLTEVEAFRADGLRSSEVIWREAIAAYPDLPVSVGLIGCDVDPQYGAEEASRSVARALFALPQVEVASHTHTHPYNWQFFERYDRAAEVAKIDAYQRPEQTLRERLSERVHLIAGKPAPVTQSNKYVAGSDDLPRTYLKNPFDLGSEIAGSLAIAESLAPPGKKARLMQWSGDTSPFAGAIAATRRAGARNINGGDSRLDREFPSVGYVPPIARSVGRERQIYAANSNENTYTNDWTGPYYGFFMLEETLRNTEMPRRLKPFNLYYHMYSGEKPAALAAVRHFLDLARTSPVAPVAASDYATIADDFFGVEIERIDAATFAVANRGALETVRFDDAETLALDAPRSSGVLGSVRHAGALYVTLDRSVERAVVALAPRIEVEQRPRDPLARPLLRDSRWRLSQASGDGCNFTLRAEGFGAGDMRFETAPHRRLDVTVMRGDDILTGVSAAADGDGILHLSLAAGAIAPVELRFACHD